MIKESIIKNLDINPYQVFFKKWADKQPVYLGEVLDALLEGKSGPEVAKIFNRSPQTFNRAIKSLFPNVSLHGGFQTWSQWLFSQSDYKKCSDCKEVKLKSDFNLSKNNYDNLDYRCRSCGIKRNSENYLNNQDYFITYRENNRAAESAKSAKRRALLNSRIPAWADLDKIKEIYYNCPTGHHVDHYYPLQGKIVCGLHVENNLQYLPARDNLSKGNKMPA